VTNAILALNAVGSANLQNGAVGSQQLANNAVGSAQLANQAVDFLQLAADVLPLGSVMLWWRPSGSTATPGGPWEIMDGRAWNSIANTMNNGSALTTGNIPDMRGAFPIGADILGQVAPGIGATGGSNTANVAHTHTVNAHTHNTLPHTHSISTDGLHYHTWGISFSSNPDYPEGLVVSGLDTWYRTNAFAEGITVKDFGGTQRSNVYGTLYIKNATYDIYGSSGVSIDAPAHMDNDGSHNHGGVTAASSQAATDATSLTTNPALSTISTVPAYNSLLFIMRVR
jgi:hypothetical protein